MFPHVVPVGRIFGISVDLDYSWFLIVGLLTWMLAVSYYPIEFRNWSTGGILADWFCNCGPAFLSVLIHEVGHSVVAKRYGLPVPRITLFLFGGVSQLDAEPASASAEFWIAIVGPLLSFALAAFFWKMEPLVASFQPLFAVVKYLALLNLVLGIFNLIPGFPLDGGRILRAILWQITGKYRRATNVAALTGRFFGFVLIFIGVWQALTGAFINGLWIAFIGWYLEAAAASQLQQEFLKTVIGEHKVQDAMKRDFPLHRDRRQAIQELVERLFEQGDSRYFLVDSNTGPVGIVTLAAVRTVPRSAWPSTLVSRGHDPAATTGHDWARLAALVGAREDGARRRQPTAGDRTTWNRRDTLPRRCRPLSESTAGISSRESSSGITGCQESRR